MIVVAGVAGFLSALGFTYATRTIARRRGFVAAPTEDRWHRDPTALLGGVGIHAGFFAALACFPGAASPMAAVVLPAALLFVLGLVDDLQPIKPYTKLIGQVVAAALAVWMGLDVPWTQNETLNGVIVMLWLVALTNAVNLLDNMNGLAAGTSFVAAVFLAIAFQLNGQADLAIVPAALAGALLGFLVFNAPPASIFMGDSGSLPLGFLLGGIALLGSHFRSRSLLAVMAAPVLIMSIPIFDTIFVTVARVLSGRPISQGGTDHTSHRLVALGVPERTTVVALVALAVVSGSIGLLVRWLNTEEIFLLVPLTAISAAGFGLYLGRVRIVGTKPASVDATVLPVVEGPYRRRVVEVTLDAILISLAYLGAYVLRFEGEIPDQQVTLLSRTLPIVVSVQLVASWWIGIYRGLWHYVGISDLVEIGKAVALGSGLNGLVLLGGYASLFPSRSVVILNGLLVFLLICGSRVFIRVLRVLIPGTPQDSGRRRVLIYGAGDGGELLLRELLNNHELAMAPIGFVDDDGRKAGRVIHGYPILSHDRAVHLVDVGEADAVLVSSPKVSEERLAEFRRSGVDIRRTRIEIV